MVKKLVIKNYASHKKSILNFSEGVNVIVGATDSGKSAIIESLRSVITNRPLGDSYRSYWGGDTEVRLVLDDCVIRKVKTDKEHIYFLGKEQFKAFKTSVPDEIQDALNISEVNIQSQFERHFLISQSPSEVAQHFNQVARLDKIDTAHKNINKWIGEKKQSIKISESAIEEAEEELTKYSDLDKMEKRLVVIESFENKEIELNNCIDKLDKLLDDIDLINEELSELDKNKGALSSIDSILELYSELDKVGNDYTGLNELFVSIQDVEEERVLLEKELKEDEKLFHDSLGEVCPLCETKIK